MPSQCLEIETGLGLIVDFDNHAKNGCIANVEINIVCIFDVKPVCLLSLLVKCHCQVHELWT